MQIDKNQKILNLAAHQDDEVLGCGGLIVKAIKNKAKVKLLTLSDGVSSRFNNFSLKNPEIINSIKKRTNEAIKAQKILGIKDFFFGKFPDNRLDHVPLLDIIKMIEFHVKKFKPNMVLTHNQYETNIDHKIAYKATEVISRPTKKNTIKKVYSFEIPCSVNWTFNKKFNPTTYINIQKEFNKKIKAWNCYASEAQPFPFPRSAKALKVLAMYRGMQSGLIMAEAFRLEREII